MCLQRGGARSTVGSVCTRLDCLHSYSRCYGRKRAEQATARFFAGGKETTEQQRQEKSGPTMTGPRTFANRLKLGYCHRNYILLSFIKYRYTETEVTASLDRSKLLDRRNPNMHPIRFRDIIMLHKSNPRRYRKPSFRG